MKPAPAFSLRAVNGWRGPGAVAIAAAHFAIATGSIPLRWLQPVALVVDLFFVLSGFLIAQVYMSRLAYAAAIPEYVLRRFGRIWPLHVTMLGVLFAFELTKLSIGSVTGRHFTSDAFASEGTNSVQSIWTNLLLVHSLGFHGRETWNFPSWSLSVEFATYVVFSGFCLLSPVRRRLLTIATILMSSAIIEFVAPQHMRSTYDYGIFRCLGGFFAGTLLYDVLVRWRLPRWPLPTLVELLTIAGVILWMLLSPGTPYVLLAPAVFCFFVAVFAQERGRISQAMAVQSLQSLAELSFAIYMVHAVALILLLSALHELQRHVPIALFDSTTSPNSSDPARLNSLWANLALWFVYATAVFAGANAALRCIETPGRMFFGKLAKRLATRELRTSLRVSELERAGPASEA